MEDKTRHAAFEVPDVYASWVKQMTPEITIDKTIQGDPQKPKPPELHEILKGHFIRPATLQHVEKGMKIHPWRTWGDHPWRTWGDPSHFGDGADVMKMAMMSATLEPKAEQKAVLERKKELPDFVWEIEQSTTFIQVPIFFIRDLMQRSIAFKTKMEDIAAELAKRIKEQQLKVEFGKCYRAEASVHLSLTELNLSKNELWHSLLQRSTALAESVDHHIRNNLVYRVPISFKITFLSDSETPKQEPVSKKLTFENFQIKHVLTVTNVCQETFVEMHGFPRERVHRASWPVHFDGVRLRVPNSLPLLFALKVVPFVPKVFLEDEYVIPSSRIWEAAYATYCKKLRLPKGRFQMRICLNKLEFENVTSNIFATVDMRPLS